MPSVRVQAFLSLEQSLVDRLVKSWLRMAKTILPDILAALREKDYATAEALINDIDLEPIVEENREYMRFITISYLLFGATRLTPDVRRTSLVGLIPNEVVDAAVANLEASVMGYVEDSIRENLMQRVADIVLADEQAPLEESEGIASVEAKAELVTKAKRIVNPLVSFQQDATTDAAKVLQLTASLHASRLSAYGFTAEADVLEVVEYELSAQLDSRVCPICEYMDGKVFRVTDAREALDVILREQNPDALKTMQSWPKQDEGSVEFFKSLSDEALIDKNWHLPPFHPGCRCLLVHVESVPQIASTPSFIESAGGGEGVEDIDVKATAEAAVQREAELVLMEENAANYVKGQIDSADREYGHAFNPKTGATLKQYQGGNGRIDLSPEDVPMLKGAKFVHNHPSGSTLSPGDFSAAGVYGMDSVVAVTADGSKYVGRARDVSRISVVAEVQQNMFRQLQTQFHQVAEEAFEELLEARALTGKEGLVYLYHLANQVMAEMGVVGYTMETAGGATAAAISKVSKLVNQNQLRRVLANEIEIILDALPAASRRLIVWSP